MSDTNARFATQIRFSHPHIEIGASSSSPSGYTPSDLKNAYQYDSDYNGDGKKTAIICAYDNEDLQSSMDVFCESFGLLPVTITKHFPQGMFYTTDRRWLLESFLDTQYAHAFAPMAQIHVVCARDGSTDSLIECAKYASQVVGAHVVCMCFGSEESVQDKELSSFFEGSGSVFVSSSGDRGGKVSFPSTSPFCVSVGGTKLSMSDDKAQRISEIAWQNSGGGVSRIFSAQPWQARFFNIYGMAGGFRACPDVSMNGSFSPGASVYAGSLGGWINVGGTSLACAMFSGVCACILQKNVGIKTSDDMLVYLYERAGVTGYELPQYNFHDIVLGKSGQFFAQPGWDFCTGLGSPKIKQLINLE